MRLFLEILKPIGLQVTETGCRKGEGVRTDEIIITRRRVRLRQVNDRQVGQGYLLIIFRSILLLAFHMADRSVGRQQLFRDRLRRPNPGRTVRGATFKFPGFSVRERLGFSGKQLSGRLLPRWAVRVRQKALPFLRWRAKERRLLLMLMMLLIPRTRQRLRPRGCGDP